MKEGQKEGQMEKANKWLNASAQTSPVGEKPSKA